VYFILYDTMANAEEQYKLSQEQIDFFLENGWLKLSNCFTREQAEGLQETLWTRLGMDPNDMSTWYDRLPYLMWRTCGKSTNMKSIGILSERICPSSMNSP
jgi:hypothetical protein